MVAFSAPRDAFAALPSGPLALNDVRTPEFVIHEDRRVVAYHAPFGCPNPPTPTIVTDGDLDLG